MTVKNNFQARENIFVKPINILDKTCEASKNKADLPAAESESRTIPADFLFADFYDGAGADEKHFLKIP